MMVNKRINHPVLQGFLLVLMSMLVISCGSSKIKEKIIATGTYTYQDDRITSIYADSYDSGDGLKKLNPPQDMTTRERYRISNNTLEHYNPSGKKDHTFHREANSNDPNPFLGTWMTLKDELEYQGYGFKIIFTDKNYTLSLISIEE